MAALQWPDKDPNEVLDYVLDWSAVLAPGDTISTSAWIVPAEVTKDSDTASDDATTIWLSGGAVGQYLFTNRITTAGGRTFDQTVGLDIRER